MFAGPLNPGATLIVQYLSKCWPWCFESWNRTHLNFVCRFLILKGIKFALVVQKLCQFLMNLCKDYFALRHLRNCNLTWEGPQIFTRRPQTPDKGIGTLFCKCYTQEVFDGFDFKRKIEGNQTYLAFDVEFWGEY